VSPDDKKGGKATCNLPIERAYRRSIETLSNCLLKRHQNM